MTLRVAMVGDFPENLDRIDGGVHAVTAYLAAALAAIPDVELTLVSFSHNGREEVTEVFDGVKLYWLAAQRLGLVTGYVRDGAKLRACLDSFKPDIVHAQDGRREAFLALKSGYPSVLTFHGMTAEDARYLTDPTNRLRLRLQAATIEATCVKKYRHAILISPYVKEYFGAKLTAKTHFIPNPIVPPFFAVKRQEEPGHILFAGRIIPRKGVSDLIQALGKAKSHVPMKLYLAGSLDDTAYVAEIKAQATELGVTDDIEFMGLLNEAEVLAAFSKASVLVLPSYQETAPVVIQQAIAAGLPIIATRICGVPYQVEDGKNGLLFTPGDTDTLAKHLVTILSNDKLRATMAAENKLRAEQYRAETVAARTVDVYREILASPAK